MHEFLDDRLLDDIAMRCGMASGIGRLSFANDAVLERLAAPLRDGMERTLLDLGCGRGFLGRWLAQRMPFVRYCGIDASRFALRSARTSLERATLIWGDYREVPYPSADAIVMLDSLFEDFVGPALAMKLTSALRASGWVFLGVSALSRLHATEFRRSIASFEDAGCDAEIEEFTDLVVMDALEFARAWLDADWPLELRDSFCQEARDLINAVDRKEYSYLVLTARKRSS